LHRRKMNYPFVDRGRSPEGRSGAIYNGPVREFDHSFAADLTQSRIRKKFDLDDRIVDEAIAFIKSSLPSFRAAPGTLKPAQLLKVRLREFLFRNSAHFRAFLCFTTSIPDYSNANEDRCDKSPKMMRHKRRFFDKTNLHDEHPLSQKLLRRGCLNRQKLHT